MASRHCISRGVASIESVGPQILRVQAQSTDPGQVSGGGGWGLKKGLLSLDPQRTHLELSDEEQLARFVQMADGPGFQDRGGQRQIQFFTTPRAPRRVTESPETGIVFGVPYGAEGSAAKVEEPESVRLVGDHFGALSSEGIFTAEPATQGDETIDESKLSVPGSRIYVNAVGRSGK